MSGWFARAVGVRASGTGGVSGGRRDGVVVDHGRRYAVWHFDAEFAAGCPGNHSRRELCPRTTSLPVALLAHPLSLRTSSVGEFLRPFDFRPHPMLCTKSHRQHRHDSNREQHRSWPDEPRLRGPRIDRGDCRTTPKPYSGRDPSDAGRGTHWCTRRRRRDRPFTGSRYPRRNLAATRNRSRLPHRQCHRHGRRTTRELGASAHSGAADMIAVEMMCVSVERGGRRIGHGCSTTEARFHP